MAQIYLVSDAKPSEAVSRAYDAFHLWTCNADFENLTTCFPQCPKPNVCHFSRFYGLLQVHVVTEELIHSSPSRS